MLAAPIILYDYPRVAPESHGDLFDATEIDEILTLRILTLTDAEKSEMSGFDARARALLLRTEALDGDQTDFDSGGTDAKSSQGPAHSYHYLANVPPHQVRHQGVPRFVQR